MTPLTNYARREQARRLALELMALHGLHDWRFAFNKRKRHLGLCCYEAKTILLSVYLVERNEVEEVRDTILHEIAHALVGPGHGHDRTWKRKCVEIGARPQRCGRADMPRGRWQARCGGCGRQYHRHRRPRRLAGWHCRSCGPERGKLLWEMGNQQLPGEGTKVVDQPPG
jgi:predicted SprT family Zn-dependent metalloprotease